VFVDGAADSVLVEGVARGTLNAVSVRPGLASEVVVDQLQEVGVTILRTQCGKCGFRVDLGQVHGLGKRNRSNCKEDGQSSNLNHGNNKNTSKGCYY
jgi:hypothetical protein